MKIINQTIYRTDHLRAFVVRIAEKYLDPGQRRKLTVRFRTTRRQSADEHGRHTSGYAYMRGRLMQVGVPKERLDKVDLAHTIAHEIGHIMGLSHRKMSGIPAWMRCGNWRDLYAWAADLPLEIAPEPAKARPDDSRKLAHVEVQVARWQTKVKRATTMLKKWQRKQKYYEKKLTSSKVADNII